jgi:hypothetical protein
VKIGYIAQKQEFNLLNYTKGIIEISTVIQLGLPDQSTQPLALNWHWHIGLIQLYGNISLTLPTKPDLY